MSTFQDRITLAEKREQERRIAQGEPRLTKTMIWKAAEATSAAATHWFNGSNAADLDTCFRMAPLLRVNPHWLHDESASIDAPYSAVRENQRTIDLPAILSAIPTLTPNQVERLRAELDYKARIDALADPPNIPLKLPRSA